MKRKYGFVAILLFAILIAGAGLTKIYVNTEKNKEEGQLKVVTSFYPMYIATMNVIGDSPNVTLENLSEPQTGCLHDYQLTPADMKLLSTADVFVVNGGGIESFLSDIAKSYPSLTMINASDKVELIEEEESQNAHAWMDITDYIKQVKSIADGLEARDPSYATTYEANAKAYITKLSTLEKEADEVKKLTTGKDVIIFHEAYAYVAKEFGMHVDYTMDLDEERQVSAGEVAQVVGQIKDHGVKTVLAEELYGKDMGDTVERETDAKVYYLDTMVRGKYEADSYLNAMKKNIQIIKEAFAK
jgi:zinc transport system substrate-binding protein